MILLIMGVSGAGKTTIGQRLAQALGWPFYDADQFHPPANVAKMQQGIPLTDEDRWPWLQALRAHMETCIHQGRSAAGRPQDRLGEGSQWRGDTGGCAEHGVGAVGGGKCRLNFLYAPL
jgi:Shikimate kinase